MKHQTTPRRRRGQFASLAAYLKATGVTQEALAAAVGSTQAHISRLAAGETLPRPALAAKLATYCNVRLDSFTREYLKKRSTAASA